MKLFFKFLLGVIVIISIGVCFFYFFIQNKFPVDHEKYQHYIGYIDNEDSMLSEGFLTCNDEKIYYVHHGAANEGALKNGKNAFKKFISENYNAEKYTDSGYISYRFLVNCEGKSGRFDVVKMNLDLEEMDLDNKMVNELLQLTSNDRNWNILRIDEEPIDYYVYILYRIENGKVVEILP